MNRRDLLARLGAVTATGALAGCDEETSPTPTPEPTTDQPDGEQTTQPIQPDRITNIADEWGFDEVVDLKRQGADLSGEKPINDIVDDAIGEGVLFYLPPGRYRIENSIAARGIMRIGFVGDDATIVPPDGFSTTLVGLGWPDPGEDLLFSGIDFDFSADETGGRPIYARADNRIVLRDVTVNGVADVNQDLVRLDVTSEDGSGLVERLSLPDGGLPEHNTTGCQVGSENRGDVSFVDCHIAGFPDNGLYADPPSGSVEVLGGTYLNNGIAGVRVQTSAESVVRGVHVRCDTDSGGDNMRGIRLRAGSDITVENCVVDLQKVTSSDGAIVFSSELGAGTVRNCRINVDADDVAGIRIKPPNDDTPAETGPFRFENVVITGNASDGSAVAADDRDDCFFQNLCVHQTGDNRDGFVFSGVQGKLVDSFVSVPGRPFAFTDSSVTKRNVTVDDSPETTDRTTTEHCK